MSNPNLGGLSGFSFAELFALEAEEQTSVLTQGLLALEKHQEEAHWLEALMRAAHSLKGAARIVGRDAAVRLTHCMEDCFVSAQNDPASLPQQKVDLLLLGVDLLTRMAGVPEAEIESWDLLHAGEVDAFVKALSQLPPPSESPSLSSSPENEAELQAPPALPTPAVAASEPPAKEPPVREPAPVPPPTKESAAAPKASAEVADRSLRITSNNLNRLMGLAGEIMVTSRWSDTFTAELMRLKKAQQDLARTVGNLRENIVTNASAENNLAHLDELQKHSLRSQEMLSGRLEELDAFDRRFSNLSSRLYQEVLECRMRPFADGVQGFPRMVRDVARSLGKEVNFVVEGESTTVDRDILERIEAPLSHLLRNAIDHGLEPADIRARNGKVVSGTIRLEAYHHAGMLMVSVSDDGAGIDVERLRIAVVEKSLTTAEVARDLSDSELLEFLFLPGFTLKREVTEISGRGVGLDAVQTMIREIGGVVRVSTQLGQGTQFQLQLPLTLSVMRTLLVEISGEPYAFPLARIVRALRIPREEIESLQGRQHFAFAGQRVGLALGHQVLGLSAPASTSGDLPVVVLGDKTAYYGVVVDRLLREQELVVRRLDPRLGKVPDISSAALLPDRSPVLIIDVEDLIRSIDNLVAGDRIAAPQRQAAAEAEIRTKRVLVVDDSLTVRELERKLLQSRGYHVDVAVDGMDGWNAIRAADYDLLITDVDMPRLDGIELVTLLKQDARLGNIPVMIVSYKDREEDRRRGLDAGADYYLTKSSFHDESLLDAVTDLIGEASA